MGGSSRVVIVAACAAALSAGPAQAYLLGLRNFLPVEDPRSASLRCVGAGNQFLTAAPGEVFYSLQDRQFVALASPPGELS